MEGTVGIRPEDWLALGGELTLDALAERGETTAGEVARTLRRLRRGSDPVAPRKRSTKADPSSDRPAQARLAWKVTVRREAGEAALVVIAPSLVDAARLAARLPEQVLGVNYVGELAET